MFFSYKLQVYLSEYCFKKQIIKYHNFALLFQYLLVNNQN